MLADIMVLSLAAALVIGLVVLRGKSGGKYDVTATDAIVAATFVFLWLFVSGQISKLVIESGGLTVETADAILNASEATIGDALSAVPLGAVDKAGRDADGTIAQVVSDRAEALEYTLGSNLYSGAAIEKEIIVLTQYVFFQYVVLSRQDGSLFGVLDAHKLVRILARQPGPYSWKGFADQVNSARIENLNALKGIPSFTDGQLAVTPDTDKQEVLQKMQGANRDWLPVISAQRRFLGVISRSQLMASLILDVTTQLKHKR